MDLSQKSFCEKPASANFAAPTDGPSLISLGGDLDQSGVNYIGPLLTMAVEFSEAGAVIDLSDVGIFGSAAVRLLHAVRAECDDAGKHFSVCAVANHVSTVLDAVASPIVVAERSTETTLPTLIGRVEFERTIAQAVLRGREAVCITSDTMNGENGPEIVFVNRAFTDLTGHCADEVIGQTPKILQGPLTSRAVLDRLRSKLAKSEPFSGETINYRADGTPFVMNWRIIEIGDDESGERYLLAMQSDATEIRRLTRFESSLTYIDVQRRGDTPFDVTREERVIDAMLSAHIALIEDGVATLSYRSSDGSQRVRTTSTNSAETDQLLERMKTLTPTAPVSQRLTTDTCSELVVSSGQVGTDRAAVLLITQLHPDRVRLADPHLHEQLLSYGLRFGSTE